MRSVYVVVEYAKLSQFLQHCTLLRVNVFNLQCNAASATTEYRLTQMAGPENRVRQPGNPASNIVSGLPGWLAGSGTYTLTHTHYRRRNHHSFVLT